MCVGPKLTQSELRGRQPLTFVAKHLLTPFVTLMGQDRGVEVSCVARIHGKLTLRYHHTARARWTLSAPSFLTKVSRVPSAVL